MANGLCKYESLKDGTLSLGDIALMNDYLDMQQDNEVRIDKWRNQDG